MTKFSISRRLKSFVYAFRGIRILISTQHNAQIHVVATIAVLALGFELKIARADWALIAFAIGIVWVAEACNTALEFLADEVSLERRERIGKSKDIAAGAVLISAIAAVVIATLVFTPYLLPFMK